MRSLLSDNRRKFPIVNVILSVSFTVVLISITFWVSSIDVRVHSNATVQKSVLDSNLKFSRECVDIKKDMLFIRDQLTVIQTALITND